MSQPENIFKLEVFEFPYLYKFPGQASDEVIFYATRESKVLLYVRQASILVMAVLIVSIGLLANRALGQYLTPESSNTIGLFVVLAGFLTLTIGWWWSRSLWRKSIALVTNKRLKKIIYTTPFNRHTLSLPLEMIVDTGSYSKGFLQALLGLGTFTARSSAASSGVATDDSDRVNKKYFYIENVGHVEDLQQYISKLLSAFRKNQDDLHRYRPFIPKLKGDARKAFMQQYPEYWS